MTATSHTTDVHALEARVALRLVASLNAQAENLPADVGERLRFAREQALLRAREARAAAAPGSVGVSRSGALLLGALGPWAQRAATLLPLLLLAGGLLVIQQWSVRERVVAAATVDAQLLADALPPAAYSDPGFAEFLRSPPQP